MSQQHPAIEPVPLDYGRRTHPHERVVGFAIAVSVLGLNALSIYAAVAWSMSSWRQNIHERGWWSYWPLIWLVGSVGLLVVQLAINVALTVYTVSRGRKSLPLALRALLLLLGLGAPAVTIGGFVAICWYNHVTPVPHAVGM